MLLVGLVVFALLGLACPRNASHSPKMEVYKVYGVMVDYNLSLAEMIKAGQYELINDDITGENFPIRGTGQQEVELMLVHLNRIVTTREVLEYLNSQGLEPAKIEHLLAFGAVYPDAQREFPIVALGSSFVADGGSRYYPYLRSDGHERRLNLSWDDADDHWGGSCRFLALRK